MIVKSELPFPFCDIMGKKKIKETKINVLVLETPQNDILVEGEPKGKTFNLKTLLKQRKKPCSTTSNFSYKEKFNVR